MAFENQPITSLKVPTNSGFGVGPGVEMTNTIPAELAAYYTGPFALAACILHYTGSSTMYFYEGISTLVKVKGAVTGGQVRESYREQQTGGVGPASNVVAWGFKAETAPPFLMQMGHSDAASVAHTVLYFAKSTLEGDANALLKWAGTTDFASVKADTMYVPGHFAVKTVEYDNRAVNTAIDPQLIISVPDPGRYIFTGFINYRTSTTADLRFAFDFTGGGGELRYTHTAPTLAGGIDPQLCFSGSVIPVIGTGSFAAFQVSGGLSVSAAGSLRLGWGQNTLDAANATQLLLNSWMKLERVS